MEQSERVYTAEEGSACGGDPVVMDDVQTAEPAKSDKLALIDAKLDLLLQANGIDATAL